MLDFVRNNQKIMQIILFIFILPSFVLLGAEGYSKFMEKGNEVIKIDNIKVTQQEFDEQYKNYLAQGQANGQELSAIDTPQSRKAVLDQITDGILMQKEIERLNINLEDSQVIEYINNMPGLASIKNPDGSINVAQLKDLLQKQGMTPEQFQDRIKFLLINQYLAENIAKSSYIPIKAQQNIAKGLLEKRQVQVLNISATDLASTVQASDEQLRAFYNKDTKKFVSDEAVDLEYILINKQDLVKDMPSEEELRKYYNTNLKQFQTLEERKASHILIKIENSMDKNKAKQKANEILEKIKKEPSSFEKLAMQESGDITSAQKGGDLGYFSKGAMVKPFEDAVYKLQLNQISDLVESEFGYHIIKLTDIKPSITKPFEQVKEEVSQALNQEKAEVLFSKTIDNLSNAAMDSNNLANIAKKLNLTLSTASNITQNNNTQTTFADKRLLRAIFDPDVKNQKRNTDVIQFGNSAIIAHVSKYYPKQQQSFEQAIEKVRSEYNLIEGLKLAKQEGVSKLAAAKRGENLQFSPIQSVNRLDNKLPKELMDSIFKADVKTLPAYVGVPTSLGYALFKILKVEVVEADANTLGLVQQFSDIYAKEEMRALMQDMRKKYEVKILKDVTTK